MGGYFLKVPTIYPLGMSQANCFRTHNELTMSPLGILPFAPSDNGFDQVSSFLVTISLNNPHWTEETKRLLISTKGSVIKITSIISLVYPDLDNKNHWVVMASEIYFPKETVPISKLSGISYS